MTASPTLELQASAGRVVERALGREVVQPGGIRHYVWPASDPEGVEQPTRECDLADLELVRLASVPTTPRLDSLRKHTRGMSLAETVLFVLSRETFNFNGQAVRREPLWLRNIAEAVRREQPIRLVYPLVCKIGCWAKQMTNIGPNAGEMSCLHFFNHVNDVVKEFYTAGVVVELVCDAHLYNSSIQNPCHEVNAYVKQFADLVKRVSPETVRLHDYCHLLEQIDSGSRRYRSAYQRNHRLLRARMDEALSGTDTGSLFDSVRALVNTRRLGLRYEDQRALFGPEQDRTNPH